MKLNFKIPFECYISGPDQNGLALQSSFTESKHTVNLTLQAEEGTTPYELKEASTKEDKYFVKIDNLKFTVTLLDTNLNIFPQPTKEEKEKIFGLIVKIVNRSLQVIRNFGLVPHIQVFNPDITKIDFYFSKWNLRIEHEGVPEITFSPQSLLSLALLGSSSLCETKDTPCLYTYRWPDIDEALQDQADAPPEKEFFTNTLEFLRVRNFRMALLESVICLEIIFTQFLKTFLDFKKKIPKSRIKSFLSPEMGLSARLAVLLDLTLDQNDLKDVEIDKVIIATRWRNAVVHKTGHLPRHIKEEQLRDGIANVLALSQILARKKRQIELEPELQTIAKEISETNNVPIPSIFHLGRHFYSVRINFLFKEIPREHILKQISEQLAERMKQYDSRMDPSLHLFISFERFPNRVCARWRKGEIEIYEEDKLVA